MPSPPITAEENFIEAVQLLHGLEVTEDDLDSLYADWAAREQSYQRATYYAKTSPDAWYSEVYEQNNRVIGIVFSTALGFISGGPLGAALGFAGALVKSFFSGSRQDSVAEDESFNQSRGFENGGALAPFGTQLPMVYCSRTLDPNGGARVGGILIHSRIETLLGTNTLYQLYAISAGQSAVTGWGQLGNISDQTLFNNQPRTNFTAAEISTFSRIGTQAQTAIAEFPFYSQVLSPPDYAVFGIDERSRINEIIDIDQNNTNTINVTFAGDTATKTGGVADTWDAGFFSTVGINRGGFLQFTPGQLGTERAIGLSNTDIDQDVTSIEYAWYFTAAGVLISENGNLVFGPVPYNAADVFRIEPTANTNQVLYLINGALVYTSAIAPNTPLFADAAFFTAGSQLSNIITSAEPGGVRPTVGISTTFTVDEDELALFDPSEEYSLCDGLIGSTATDFRIIAKDVAASTVTADQNLNLANTGIRLYAYWIARYETTKRVSRTDFNLAFNVSARNSNGELVLHAVGFDLWMRAVTTPLGGEQFIARFIIRSKNPSTIRRGFRIINQPLGRYYYELRPLCGPECDILALELIDTGQLTIHNSGVEIAGRAVMIEGEIERVFDPASPDADQVCDFLTSEFSYENKVQVTSEQGPTGRIISVNEIVDPAAINIPAGGGANPYPGLSLQGYQFLASERLQQPPGTRTLVEEGRICPNLMAAGDASVLSTPTVLNDPTADFIAAGVQVGQILRNITQKVEAQVTVITQTTLETATALNWAEKDRYLAFFLGSTAYFPDIFADLLADDIGGIRTLIGEDYIDYPSLVSARQFCVLNNFFWNGIIEQSTPFIQWAATELISARLLPLRIDGRLGLLPDQLTPVAHSFNASNTRSVREEFFDWQPTITNRLIVLYTDGRDLFTQDGVRFREKTITISTLALFNGLEPPSEDTLNLKNVSGPDQATAIGITYFNSRRLQNRGIQFQTGYHAAFLQAGELISFQHSALDIDEEYSGFVFEAEAFNAGVQRVRLDCQPKLSEGYVTSPGTTGVTDSNADFTQTAVVAGDLLLNTTVNTSALITAITANQLTAAISFAEDDCYCVLNLTPPVDLLAFVTFREDASSQEGLSFFFVQVGDEVWLEISGLNQPLVRLDSVNIGSATNLYRVQSVTPDGKATFSVSGIFHPGADLYSAQGLVIERDDELIVN